MPQLSETQILCGVREVLYSDFWITLDFDADTNLIDAVNQTDQFDEYDILDVLHCIARFFGFTSKKSDWLEFFSERGYGNFEEWKKQQTFGALAGFIAERAPVQESFAPIPMLDKPCASAGTFLGMQSLADRLITDCTRFAPSTPIIEVMRGKQLRRFWRQLRWMTCDVILPLPSFWQSVKAYAFWIGLLLIALGVIGANVTKEAVWISAGFASAVCLYMIASLYQFLVNPLPRHLTTFRDVAKAIELKDEYSQSVRMV